MRTISLDRTKEARDALNLGELVLIPTDTVYGIAAAADDQQACAKLYRVKGRAVQEPMAVIFAGPVELRRTLPGLSRRAQHAINTLLPGPYTLVVANEDCMYPWLCGDDRDRIGIRVPEGSLLLPPVAATSANIAGQPEATTVDGLPQSLAGEVEVAIDAGPIQGEASTVLDITRWERHAGGPIVLRDDADRAMLALKMLDMVDQF